MLDSASASESAFTLERRILVLAANAGLTKKPLHKGTSMLDKEWFLLDLNPEPWTAPEVGIGRKAGKIFPQFYKNEQLRAYQAGVKETLVQEYPEIILRTGLIGLEFYLWRQLPVYSTDKNRLARKHVADATNMQKALEDALQGVLFDNDRNVKSIKTVILEQDYNTQPQILIAVFDYSDQKDYPNIFRNLQMQAKQKRTLQPVPEPVHDDDLF